MSGMIIIRKSPIKFAFDSISELSYSHFGGMNELYALCSTLFNCQFTRLTSPAAFSFDRIEAKPSFQQNIVKIMVFCYLLHLGFGGRYEGK